MVKPPDIDFVAWELFFRNASGFVVVVGGILIAGYINLRMKYNQIKSDFDAHKSTSINNQAQMVQDIAVNKEAISGVKEQVSKITDITTSLNEQNTMIAGQLPSTIGLAGPLNQSGQ